MYAKAGLVLLAISLVAVLAFGGFAHAVIPHEHGDGRGGTSSVLWSDLHAVLGSARKMFFTAIDSVLLVLLFSIVRYGEKIFLLARRRAGEIIRSLDPMHGESLRCGVMPYRAFR